MTRLFLLFVLATLIMNPALAENLNSAFSITYFHHGEFDRNELEKLKHHEIILISGVLAEIATAGDKSAPLNFSLFSGDYFGEQVKILKSHDIDVKRIESSSLNIEITKANIKKELENAQSRNKKVIFMTHSLGGLVLLDYLIKEYPVGNENIDGIVFLQSPFYGSPIADLCLSDEFPLKKMARPILPLINLSEETLKFVTVEFRKRYMDEHYDAIDEILKKIPTITVSGISNGQKSVSTPMVEIMHHGCIGSDQKSCSGGKIIYGGPYDLSDGMVPLRSSILPRGDTIVIKGFDHTEAVLNQNYIDFDQQMLTVALLKLMLEKVADKPVSAPY